MKAAVLAAGSGGAVASAAGVPCKALVPIAGRPMVRRVVDALLAAQTIDETLVIHGPAAPLPDDAVAGATQVCAAGEGFSDTVSAAAHAAGGGLLCVVTADLPALTPQAIDATVDFAMDSGADLTYTMAETNKVLEAFPGTTRTTVRLREGSFTGGNLVVVRRDTLLHSLARIDSAFGRRKSIVGLTLLLGPMFLFRLALGRLNIEAAAARGAQILDCSVAVHVSPHPEIAFDVDKPSDLAAAEALLGADRPPADANA